MKRIFNLLLSFILIPLVTYGAENFEIGSKIYAIDSCEIWTLPVWKGELVEKSKRGSVFAFLSYEENGHWLKIKTHQGKEGFVAATWVTPDIQIIDKKKSDEIARKTEKQKSKQNKIDALKKKHPSWSAKDCETILAGKVRIGMDVEQCRESWGNPDRMNNTTTAYGTDTQWCYGDFCSSALYFHNGILRTIQN
ncbi:MAG TPA: hypothetical protein DCW42_06165 [Bacteroidetes bacterium]|nr:hypothetical protein [Bacteroidota bacterium]